MKTVQSMAIIYSCDFCEKEFNLQIKLKKYIQADHASPKELDPSDFLDEDIEFTDDEKAEYYDDLKAKYDGVKNKVEFFEKRYSFISKDISSPPPEKIKTESAKTFSSRKSRSKLNWDSKNEGEVYKDPYMPENWQSKFAIHSDGNKRFFFIASDGTYLVGRKPSLLHMRNVLESPESDIVLMKRGMIEEECWIESDCIPQGWLTKCCMFPGKREDYFFTHKFEFFKSKSVALRELLHNGYTNREISNFISGFMEKNIQSNKIVWENDARIPNGWMVGSALNQKLYVLPWGYVVTAKKTVKGHIKNSKDLDEVAKKKFLGYIEGLELISNFFGCEETKIETKAIEGEEIVRKQEASIEQSENWVPPSGWIRKTKGFKTPDENHLNSAMQVVGYLRNNGYSEDYIDHYKEKGHTSQFKNSDDLPPGWREAVTSAEYSGGTLTHKYFMSPNGTILKSRALSIKYMMDNLFERSHIETMFRLLMSEDGWQNDENLPEGWMKKQMQCKTVFMSPTLEIFKKKHAVITFMENQDFYPEVIRKTKEYLFSSNSPPATRIKRELSGESSDPPNKKIKIEKIVLDPIKPKSNLDDLETENNLYVPHGLTRTSKGFRTENGENLNALHEIIPYMKNNGYSKQEIDNFKERGITTKFRKTDGLPPDWMSASLTSETKTGTIKRETFLSPNGVFFNNRAKAIKYMIDNEFEESHIQVMKSLLVNQDGWQVDENLPEGWMEKQMSVTTAFLSPTWETFTSKIAVIAFMNNQGLDIDVIKKTEKYLYAGKSPPTMSNKREASGSQEQAVPPTKKIKTDKAILDWKPDSSLPSGWLSARDSDNNIHISNSKGDTFSSRIEAMRAMIETKQSPDDIFKMWKSLDAEGWVCDEDYLPPGWRRKHSDDSETHTYLSPLMEVIESTKAFLDHIENSSDYNNDDLKKVKMWIKINEL